MYRVLERGMVLTRFVSSKRTPERRMFQVKLETRQLIWSRGSVMGRPEGVGKFPPLCSTVWQHLCVCVCVRAHVCGCECWHSLSARGGGGGALPLWESVGMRRGFAPHFRHLDDLFAPKNLTMSTILFRSCWVPFRSPTFSACRRSFCPQNWPNLSFYSDLVGSRFELRAAHPYWFWTGVPPPPGLGDKPGLYACNMSMLCLV